MALLGGAGAALAMLSMPVGLIETMVASSGVSEMLPAAAPPLGMKARLALALFTALMAMGIIWAMRREARFPALAYEGRSDEDVRGAHEMGFALSRLAAFARGRGRPSHMPDAPMLRRADAHPDAPARAPIFASRDFDGLDIFGRNGPARLEVEEGAENVEESVGGLTLPNAPTPLSDEELLHAEGALPLPATASHDWDIVAEDVEIFEASTPIDQEETPVSDAPPETATARFAETDTNPSIERLSIADLTARLERGLAERARLRKVKTDAHGVIADMPVAHAVPVRDAVLEDVDIALRDALGTLRTMAGRTR